jgi:hypothetical protein
MSNKQDDLLAFERTKLRRLRQFHRARPVHLVVHQWLSPISVYEEFQQYGRTYEQAHADFQKITAVVEGAVRNDKHFGELLDVIAEFVGKPLGDQHLALYQKHGQRKNLLTAYVSVVYARALHVLRNSWFGSAESDQEITRWVTGDWIDKSVAHIKARLEQFGPDFIGHLLMESADRAEEDPDFGQRLGKAMKVFEGSVPHGHRSLLADKDAKDLKVLHSKDTRMGLGLQAHVAFAFTLWD